MIYPSIDKLLNIVSSKYKLVHIVARRANQMYETKQYQKKEESYQAKKNIGRALEELVEGLVRLK
ncbi:MAG: DNA-directed RNA polymerase subunit omega [Bacilli bacterium]|jgi:DNA-directed RNA polymerase subunit omega